MRIIGGEFRGRKIEQPGTDASRPTKDRVREAVFNMIAAEVPGAKVLDIFAGSGAYGLESLSRGAEKALFIERDQTCVKAISGNISILGVSGRAEIITQDAETALAGFAGQAGFDLVFADPPFNRGMTKNILIMINHYDILNPSGFAVIEHHASESLPDAEGVLSICKQKTYGDISISVYKRT